jgi:ankyrin repeat protein
MPQQVTRYGWTALITACHRLMPEVALALLKTGQARPEQVTSVGDTALIQTLYKADINKMKNVSLKLIATGKARPEQRNKEGQSALFMATRNNNSKIALALLKTGKTMPADKHQSNKNTALIYACKNKMTEVALKILENCKSNPAHIQKNGYTALYWVNKNHLPKQLKERLEEMLVKCHTRKTKASHKTKKTLHSKKNKTKKRL